MTETIIVAERNGFKLYERSKASRNGWLSLKLVRSPANGKRRREEKYNWCLGWNGKRLSRCSDTARLADDHPFVYAWVLDTLEGLDG